MDSMSEHTYNPKSRDNLKPSPLAGPKLSAGEQSAVVRIRGDEETIAWFSGLSASERGQVLASVRPRKSTRQSQTPRKPAAQE